MPKPPNFSSLTIMVYDHEGSKDSYSAKTGLQILFYFLFQYF